jgi:acyl-coenzyme A thioesterase PaaI-like protein
MSMDAFVHDDTPTEEIDRREAVVAGLAGSVRELVDATIRSTVADDEIRAVQAEVDALVARLRASQLDGPAGVRYNSEGHAWDWGNAVVGARNAVAPPLDVQHPEPGVAWAEADLGAAYEGPPGMVHGGVAALLLDQVMGETASFGFTRVAMTGTLTLRYTTPTPLGPVRLDGRIEREQGRKIHVVASIGPRGGEPTVEATGLFIVPRWAVPSEETREIAPA